MDSDRFARILGEDMDGIERALAEIEEQSPAQIFASVKDLIGFLQQGDLEIAEEAVGVFADTGVEGVVKVLDE